MTHSVNKLFPIGTSWETKMAILNQLKYWQKENISVKLTQNPQGQDMVAFEGDGIKDEAKEYDERLEEIFKGLND